AVEDVLDTRAVRGFRAVLVVDAGVGVAGLVLVRSHGGRDRGTRNQGLVELGHPFGGAREAVDGAVVVAADLVARLAEALAGGAVLGAGHGQHGGGRLRRERLRGRGGLSVLAAFHRPRFVVGAADLVAGEVRRGDRPARARAAQCVLLVGF